MDGEGLLCSLRNSQSKYFLSSTDFLCLYFLNWFALNKKKWCTGAEDLTVNQIQDENVDNSQGYVEVGRIENDDEVIIVQIENPNIPLIPIDAEPHNRTPDDMNPLEQQPAEVNSDESILTPNRKKRKRFFFDTFAQLLFSIVKYQLDFDGFFL